MKSEAALKFYNDVMKSVQNEKERDSEKLTLLFQILKDNYYFDNVLTLQHIFIYFNHEDWSIIYNTSQYKILAITDNGIDLTPVHIHWAEINNHDKIPTHKFEVNFLGIENIQILLEYLPNITISDIEKEQFKLMNL